MKKKRKKQNKSLYYFCLLLAISLVMLYILDKSNEKPKTADEVVETVNVQTEAERQAFFKKIESFAKKNQQKYGIFASVTMAQAALESDFGSSQLATKYFNLFGVKGTKEKGVLLPTTEFKDGEYKKVTDYFAQYESWEESIKAHGRLLFRGTDWNSDQYEAVLKADSYKEAAKALVKGGYATDPQYAQKIIKMIEQYHLYQYDKETGGNN